MPEKAHFWIIDKDSETVKEYGIQGFQNEDFEKALLLYLPGELKGDFLLKDAKIEDGSLHLSIDNYLNCNNEILSEGDVRFYQLLDMDVSSLSENYRVYITINTVSIEKAPIISGELVAPNVTMAEAILIAQNHFFSTLAKENEQEQGFIYNAECISGESIDSWYIRVFDKSMDGEIEEYRGDDYVYEISRRTGEILRITVEESPLVITEKIAIEQAKAFYIQEVSDENIEELIFTAGLLQNDAWIVMVGTKDSSVICAIEVNSATGESKWALEP
ncbi:MAG: hypothetical protein J6D23_00415 [Clostridia bacterium]|nr:hypothetical protein [Clostridia bacterium]